MLEFLELKRNRCDQMAREYANLGYPRFDDVERDIYLRILDAQWKDHLHSMDGLREGIGLRGYASRDPKIEYQREGYALFDEMNARIDQQAIQLVTRFALPPAPGEEPPAQVAGSGPMLQAPPPVSATGPVAQPGAPQRAAGDKKVGKVGRNDPCPCGSG